MRLERKCELILIYLELYKQSKNREVNITNSVFYNTFGRYNQQAEELEFQKKVTAKIWNRIVTLENLIITK